MTSLLTLLFCRYHYYVKFADLGMDWILAPEGYDAYYCSGDCPFMYLSEQKSSLYYTFVIARANYNNPMASPRPCCTPVSLSDLSIMYSSGKVDSQVIVNTLHLVRFGSDWSSACLFIIK